MPSASTLRQRKLVPPAPGPELAASRDRRGGLADRVARGLVRKRLRSLRAARLRLEEGAAGAEFGAADGVAATVRVKDPRFYRRVLFGGSIGAAESYAAGEWESPDLVAVVRAFARDAQASDRLEGGAARLLSPLRRFGHLLRRNTRRGARRNIHDHYDLGNDFFSLWLDETMTYSCGIFERPDATLAEASLAKIDHLCTKLGLTKDDHLLEIGTGWGALAIRAAERFGCRVTTTTISEEQHAFARRAVAERGLDGRITLLREDYRDLRGRFSKLVSVEMIEAIGWRQYPNFFEACARLLADDGRMILQSITIADHRFERAKRSVDFIQRRIFPGSCIPSVAALTTAAAAASDFRLVHLEDIGPHYARTLALWRERFLAARERLLDLGYPERFLREWEWYLAYCEGGFAEHYLGDAHLLFARAACRAAPPIAAGFLPPLRG